MDDKIYVDLYELIQNLFIDLIEYVNKSEDENKYIFSHHKFPMLRGYDKNGLPELWESHVSDGPKDYTSLFTRWDKEHHYNLDEITSYQNVIDFFVTHEQDFKSFVYFSNWDFKKDISRSIIRYLLLTSFDSYMHAAKSSTFNEDVFKNILLHLYNKIFPDNLSISICVPILFTKFEEDNIPITDNIKIRKLNEKELISIYKVGGYSDTHEVSTVSRALYILELENYSIPNTSEFLRSGLDYKESYPIDIIDKWFAALKTTTHIETGYGQVLSFPQNWGVRDANLIEVHGDKIKKYNSRINKYYTDIPTLSAKDLVPAIKLFNFLLNNEKNSVNIAVNRLTLAYLRETEEDAIIDLMIGIEALVTNKDFGEISYKVSTRVALILSTLETYPYNILETRQIIKHLYKFRSKVVHGESFTDKNKIIKIREDVQIDTIQIAIEVLQYLLVALSNNPSLSKADSIDTYFMEQYEKLSNTHIPTSPSE